MIMKTLEKFTKQQTEKAESNTVSGFPEMIPVPDENLNISDYRIQLSHSATEKYLDQDLAFDEVLPTMYSHLEDKIKSEEINREAIKLASDTYESIVLSKAFRFVVIETFRPNRRTLSDYIKHYDAKVDNKGKVKQSRMLGDLSDWSMSADVNSIFN